MTDFMHTTEKSRIEDFEEFGHNRKMPESLIGSKIMQGYSGKEMYIVGFDLAKTTVRCTSRSWWVKLKVWWMNLIRRVKS